MAVTRMALVWLLLAWEKKKDIPLTFKRLTEMIYTLSAATLISKKLLYEIKSGQYK